jgi:hypothetical protein
MFLPYSEEKKYSFLSAKYLAGGNDFLILARMSRCPDMLTQKISFMQGRTTEHAIVRPRQIDL